MGLDNFKGGQTGTDSSNESNETNEEEESKRQYVEITKTEFEEFLEHLPWTFKIKDYDWTNEWVYEMYSVKKGTKCIRIYSSIDKRDDKGRHVGSDAIRTVLLHKTGEDDEGNEYWRPLRKEKSTYRIQTWEKNLRKKIENIIDSKDKLKWCSECGRLMVIQTAKDSGDKFYGCVGYFDEDDQCTNTEQL